MRSPLLLPTLLLAFSMTVEAACPSDEAIAAYLSDFRELRPSKGFGPGLSPADAACARTKLIEQLPAILGPLVGYKAIFTNPTSQRRFGVTGPDWGAMFAHSMQADGVRLPARFGALPRYESDLLIVVKDAGLADADTPLEALAHTAAIVPFIELPDIMIAGAPTGIELVASNAAFRGGVLGSRIEVTAENAALLLEALASMDVVVTEKRSDRQIGREKGSVLMGNPVNAAMWLAKALKLDGITLKPGDLLSVGGFLASAPTQPGTSMTVRYVGLPGNPEVTVHFD